MACMQHSRCRLGASSTLRIRSSPRMSLDTPPTPRFATLRLQTPSRRPPACMRLLHKLIRFTSCQALSHSNGIEQVLASLKLASGSEPRQAYGIRQAFGGHRARRRRPTCRRAYVCNVGLNRWRQALKRSRRIADGRRAYAAAPAANTRSHTHAELARTHTAALAHI